MLSLSTFFFFNFLLFQEWRNISLNIWKLSEWNAIVNTSIVLYANYLCGINTSWNWVIGLTEQGLLVGQCVRVLDEGLTGLRLSVLARKAWLFSRAVLACSSSSSISSNSVNIPIDVSRDNALFEALLPVVSECSECIPELTPELVVEYVNELPVLPRDVARLQ